MEESRSWCPIEMSCCIQRWQKVFRPFHLVFQGDWAGLRKNCRLKRRDVVNEKMFQSLTSDTTSYQAEGSRSNNASTPRPQPTQWGRLCGLLSVAQPEEFERIWRDEYQIMLKSRSVRFWPHTQKDWRQSLLPKMLQPSAEKTEYLWRTHIWAFLVKGSALFSYSAS